MSEPKNQDSPSTGMKQRLTFVVPEGTFIDIKDLALEDGVFNLTGSQFAVEQRTTVSLNELPKSLRSELKDIHELHLRWSQWTAGTHVSPFTARLPPGLHVFFTPRDGKDVSQICHSLEQLLEQTMGCDNSEESFNKPAVLSERFATSATYQFYHSLRSLDGLVRHLAELCNTLPRKYHAICQEQTRAVRSAAEFHLDFDVISHALVITALWPQGAAHPHNHIDTQSRAGTVEIGVLAAEPADEREELKLGGYLAVLGEDKKPSATLFSFPSRHHPLPNGDKSVYSAAYEQPTGLHPRLRISFEDNLKPPHETCALHAYLTLPSALFLDRYQLSEPALLASNNLKALHVLSGAEELEAPDWAVKQWGSASLFELAPPERSQGGWESLIPLHLRYLQSDNATASQSQRALIAPWPIIFWACQAEEGLKMGTNPFDRVNLGYDGLFGPRTMFYHIPAGKDDLTLSLSVPTLDPAITTWLSPATLGVVLTGLAWVLWSLLGPRRKVTVKRE